MGLLVRIGVVAMVLGALGCGRGDRARSAPPSAHTDAAAVAIVVPVDAASIDAIAIDGPLFAGAAGVCAWGPPEPDPARWEISPVTLGPLPSCARPTGDDVIARFAGLPGYTVTEIDDREFGTMYVVALAGEPLIRVQPTRDQYYWGAEIVSPRLRTEQRYQVGLKTHVGQTLRELRVAIDTHANVACTQAPLADGGQVECAEFGGTESPISYSFRFAQPPGQPPRDCGGDEDSIDEARCADLRMTSILWDDIQSK